jgi:hypothetical protein
MSRERLYSRRHALSFSLPHATGVYPGCASIFAQVGQARLACGGGLGREVTKRRDVHCVTPLPTMLRIVGLPRKGGGDNKRKSPP